MNPAFWVRFLVAAVCAAVALHVLGVEPLVAYAAAGAMTALWLDRSYPIWGDE